jgi:membrane-bound lytic murein transglycosylase D
MALFRNPIIVLKKSLHYFFMVLLLSVLQTAAAQSDINVDKKLPLVGGEKRVQPSMSVKKSAVVFPEILKGNEEEALSYIEKFSADKRGYLIRMYSKGKQLLPKAAAILSKYSLPTELKILLTLESAYNANAVSKAGAVGYWQIMDEVAKEYGMKYIKQQSAAEKKKATRLKRRKADYKRKPMLKIKDDRKNFVTSTHTAARYLRDRRRNLDDNWLLIVASYNCGVGNVWKAMAKSGKTSPSFWDVKKYLPAETRAYVMNFITLNVIFANYELFVKNKLSFINEEVATPDDSTKEYAVEQVDYFE